MSLTRSRRRGRIATLTSAFIGVCLAFTVSAAAEPPDPLADPEPPTTNQPTTADHEDLNTWWHDNYELNSTGPVEAEAVRRSPYYDVKVASAQAAENRYDSFTYMSIPRSGKEKVGYTKEDGAEFSADHDLSMSWSSFEYDTDVWVDVTLRTGETIDSADQVTIRPRSLDFETALVDKATVRIKVPYSEDGYRFSVEFDPQLITAYNDMTGTSGVLTTEPEPDARPIHTEPGNSVLVFAEPILKGAERDELIPDSTSGTIHYPDPGEVRDLHATDAEILYFRPGTYYMGNDYHALLPEQVKWVYLAPGAYVKGAFRFPSDVQDEYKVTGYGVLSGEQYVYEADTREAYNHRTEATDCHADCVKMLQFASKDAPQHLDLQGITINEPPYHSFVVYGNEQTFTMNVRNYKQVGSWYWQTDGIELYAGGTMNNTFFHANDDVLKMYHSDVRIDNTVIWKNENGPVIQWGWTPREIDNVLVTNTHIIHNRMYWKDVKYNTCILNSSSHWEDMESTTTANPEATVKNMRFENITVEGDTNCALRIYALANTENIHIKNLSIDGWNGLDASSQVSHLKRYTNADGEPVTLGNETHDSRGIKLENYTVGGTAIEKAGENWSADQLGRLDFDGENWDNWNAWASLGTGTPSPGLTDPGSPAPTPEPTPTPGGDSPVRPSEPAPSESSSGNRPGLPSTGAEGPSH